MRKEYVSPEFEFYRVFIEDTICTSYTAETPIDDVWEDDYGDDV